MMAGSNPSPRPAPLRLVELVFPKIAIEALIPEGSHDRPRVLELETADVGFQYQVHETDNSVSVGMRLRTLPMADGAANTGRFYEVDVEAFALFEMVGAEHRDSTAEYLRKVSAASALLGAIREQVAMTTARGPWGVLTIPLVGMDAIIDRLPSAVAKPTEETAAPAPATEKKAKASRKKTTA